MLCKKYAEGKPADTIQGSSENGDIEGDGLRSGLQDLGSDGQEQGSGDAEVNGEMPSGTGLADAGTGRTERDSLKDYNIEDPKKLIGGTPKKRFNRKQSIFYDDIWLYIMLDSKLLIVRRRA